MKLLKYLSLLGLISCSSADKIQQELDSKNYYKRDMIITYDNDSFEGVAVLPNKKQYELLIEAKGDLDLFVMNTCHKEETKEKAWNVTRTIKSGLFGWGTKKITLKREVGFIYYPTNSLEDDGDCIMELGGYEAVKGRHSWAMIDFENPQYSLPSTVLCNGRQYISNGTTLCQSRKGLIQKLIFQTPVIVSPDPGCELPNNEGKVFEFEIKRGKCVYIFQEITGKKRHKMTTFGYESILIREEIK